MKNLDLIILINAGILNITNNDLPAASAYKVVKLRNVLSKAFEKLQELERDLLKDKNIDDPQKFSQEIETLRNKEDKTEEDEAKLKELTEKFDDYINARTEFLNDDTPLEGIKTISYEDWHTLRKENRPKDGNNEILNNYVESILENVFWKAPEDE